MEFLFSLFFSAHNCCGLFFPRALFLTLDSLCLALRHGRQ